MLRVGLTGGIGSGKSTVAARLAEHGAVVIDADRIAREVVEPGTEGLRGVVEAFGAEVLAADGSLDRAALAQRVFNDDEARRTLNGIVHPLIGARTRQLTEDAVAAAEDVIIVHDVPLLVEGGMAALYHLAVIVDADVDKRVRRLVRHRDMPEADARARIAAQADEAARRAVADIWLDNSGTPDQIVAIADALWADQLVPFEANVRLRRYSPRGAPRLVDSKPDWPARAERVMARLRLAAGGVAKTVHHIGSTAVPGLPAKDVIDIQLGVPSLDEADAIADALAQAGFPRVPDLVQDSPYPADADPAQWQKRVHSAADPVRWANVHLRVVDSASWRHNLLFRDWLRANDDRRDEYVAMKRATAAAHASGTIQDYAAAKEPWFERILAPMHDWAAATGWTPPDR